MFRRFFARPVRCALQLNQLIHWPWTDVITAGSSDSKPFPAPAADRQHLTPTNRQHLPEQWNPVANPTQQPGPQSVHYQSGQPNQAAERTHDPSRKFEVSAFTNSRHPGGPVPPLPTKSRPPGCSHGTQPGVLPECIVYPIGLTWRCRWHGVDTATSCPRTGTSPPGSSRNSSWKSCARPSAPSGRPCPTDDTCPRAAGRQYRAARPPRAARPRRPHGFLGIGRRRTI